MPSSNSKLVCVRCGYTRMVGSCENCGNDSFGYTSYASFGEGQIKCIRCGDYFSHWFCPTCNTKNMVSKSLKDCFIATAVFEGKITDEVATLRSFRDRILRQHIWGVWAINIYEASSPSLAEWVSTNSQLRTFLRKFVFMPLTKKINQIYGKRLN